MADIATAIQVASPVFFSYDDYYHNINNLVAIQEKLVSKEKVNLYYVNLFINMPIQSRVNNELKINMQVYRLKFLEITYDLDVEVDEITTIIHNEILNEIEESKILDFNRIKEEIVRQVSSIEYVKDVA